MTDRRKKLSDKERDAMIEIGRRVQQRWARLFPSSADRLWLYRKSLSLTQAQMAEECDLSASTIGNMERGYSLPKGTSLVRIGKSWGISVDYLLNLSSKKEITK